MKLAVRKEPGHIPGSGYHYMTFPMAMDTGDDFDSRIFETMGYIIIEVEDDNGQELLAAARAALNHQVQIAILADAAEARKAAL